MILFHINFYICTCLQYEITLQMLEIQILSKTKLFFDIFVHHSKYI